MILKNKKLLSWETAAQVCNINKMLVYFKYLIQNLNGYFKSVMKLYR